MSEDMTNMPSKLTLIERDAPVLRSSSGRSLVTRR